MYIISGIFIFTAIACWLYNIQKKKELFTLESVPKYAISNLIGSGSTGMLHTAKVQGKIVSDEPLTSELTESECVYYEIEVYRHYTKEKRETDSEGRSRTTTEKRHERVSHNERKQPFYIDDDTGRIKVSLDGADFEKEKTLEEFRGEDSAPDASSGFNISFGGFNLKLGEIISGERTIGYEYKEWIIPTNKDALVVGGLKKDNDELCFTTPDDSRYKYLISFQSEENLVKEIKKSRLILTCVTFVCIACGITALIYQLAQQGVIKI